MLHHCLWGITPGHEFGSAAAQALAQGGAHLEGLRLRLRQLQQVDVPMVPLDLSSRPQLAAVGQTVADLRQYDTLLEGGLA